jgi:hypothetical protein
MLADVRGNITRFLKQYNVPLHLPHQSISDLYENPQFVLSKRHNKIFITMYFPLSITSIPLTLYQVIALKMPTDPETNTFPSLQELPQLSHTPDPGLVFRISQHAANFERGSLFNSAQPYCVEAPRESNLFLSGHGTRQRKHSTPLPICHSAIRGGAASFHPR